MGIMVVGVENGVVIAACILAAAADVEGRDAVVLDERRTVRTGTQRANAQVGAAAGFQRLAAEGGPSRNVRRRLAFMLRLRSA